MIAGGVLMLATFPTMLSEYRRNDSYTAYSENLKTSYDSIEISTINANLTVTNTADGIPAVDAETDPAFRVDIESKDGKLMIEEVDLRKWYQKIGIFSPKPGKIEVRLADGEYSDLNVESDNGDIVIKVDLHDMRALSFGDISTNTVNGDTDINLLTVSGIVLSKSKNGNINLVIGHDPAEGLPWTSLVSGMTTNGNITDQSVAGAKSFTTGNGRITSTGRFGMLYAKTVNGDIELNSVLGDKVNAESVNGAIKAILLKPMNYVTSSKNGRVTVPKETGESPFVASTVNGDITIEIAAGIELLDD